MENERGRGGIASQPIPRFISRDTERRKRVVPVKSHGNNAFYFRVVVTANNGNNIAGSHFARAQPLPPCSGETEVGPRGGESIKRVEGKTGGERALHRVCARRRRREAAISSVINNESSNGSSPLLALPLQPLSTPATPPSRRTG